MSGPNPLEEVRYELRRLEEPIVRALIERRRIRRDGASGTPAAPPGVNSGLERCYAEQILPFLCAPEEGDRSQESSAVDQRLLGLLARRIELGIAVADAKVHAEPERFAALARSADRGRLLEALTNREVEKGVLDRVRALAEQVGGSADAEAAAAVFERWVIPLTKDAETDRVLAGRSR